MSNEITTLTFIIPCYRSQDTLATVIREIELKMLERENLWYEIICVNDCSPDEVWETIKSEARRNKKIIGISLSKNYGQANAQMAGLNRAKGDIVVFLDDDGQCPIDHLWELIAPIEKKYYDMSIAKYPKKKQSIFKNFGSKVNNYTTHLLLDLPKGIEDSNFFAINKMLSTQVIQYHNPYPFIIGIVSNVTKRIINVPMEERERKKGTTGYTFVKLLRLWLNGFTNFSVVPLRVADVIGFICALLGFAFGIASIVQKLTDPDILMGYTSLIATILFVAGIIMILLGMLGEYMGRIFICINNIPQYVIREETDSDYE